MLGYLQTWRTHLTSHFDIPGSLEEDSNQFHTALGKFDHSREKTKRRSLLASATSAVDDLRLTTFTLNSKQLRIVELALPILFSERYISDLRSDL
ncbi:hypothetical protein D6C89_07930 [Aureobasidium pullulans]|nr:hypothetical protein D6C89_07930 [Aureobasidium pullulans]